MVGPDGGGSVIRADALGEELGTSKKEAGVSTESLERAQAVTREVLANVTVDQLDMRTPCESWNVRDVVNHLVGANNWFAGTMTEGESAPEDKNDYASGDYLSAYDSACKASVAAFDAPGALEKTVRLPFGELPAAMYLGLATNDVFAHGWDLAKATGQPTDLDPDVAVPLLAAMEAGLPDALRGPDGVAPFGPKRSAPPGAPAADKLAAFLGRTV
jgi:uncharacterized protein (TIGR03086 family)